MLIMDEKLKSKSILAAGIVIAYLAYSGRCLGGDISRSNFLFFGAWTYVFLADYLAYKRSGSSLLVSRISEMFSLALGSVAIMAIFEILNHRIGVWYYENVPLFPLQRWSGLVLWWASILPSIVVTSELLLLYGFPRRLSLKRLPVSDRALTATFCSGCVSLCLALYAPETFGLLGFAALALISEPLNYRLGLGSLLRDLSWGTGAKIARLATTGFICGLVWRGFNYFSGTQFLLNPGMGGLDGLGGVVAHNLIFPLLAIEGYSLYSLCSVFRGGKTWEMGLWAFRGKAPSPYLKWVAMALAVVVCVIALNLANTGIFRYI